MDKNTIAELLITSDSQGAIPVLLDIDEEEVNLNLKKTNGIIFFGKNAINDLHRIVSQLDNNSTVKIATKKITNNTDLSKEYHTFKQKSAYVPPLVIIIEDIDKLYNSLNSTDKKMLFEILQNGHEVQLYFLCCTTNEKLPQDISVYFPVKIENFYSSTQGNYNAIFDYIGKRQNIRLK